MVFLKKEVKPHTMNLEHLTQHADQELVGRMQGCLDDSKVYDFVREDSTLTLTVSSFNALHLPNLDAIPEAMRQGAEMSLVLTKVGHDEDGRISEGGVEEIGTINVFASQGTLNVPKFGEFYNLHGEQFLREPPQDLIDMQDPVGTAAALQNYIHEEIQRVVQHLPQGQGVPDDFDLANPVDAMSRLLMMQRDHQNTVPAETRICVRWQDHSGEL